MSKNKDTWTLQFYDDHAEEYVKETLNIPINEIQDAFLEHIPMNGHILDLGCGSGRDSLYFLKKGFRVTAMDGSQALCDRASEILGQKVLCASFEEFVTDDRYDGIWACASLLHLESGALKDAIAKYLTYLKHGGVFYMSFKYGTDENYLLNRYFNQMDEVKFRSLIGDLEGYEIFMERLTLDARMQRRSEKWYNVIIHRDDI